MWTGVVWAGAVRTDAVETGAVRTDTVQAGAVQADGKACSGTLKVVISQGWVRFPHPSQVDQVLFHLGGGSVYNCLGPASSEQVKST